MNTKTKTQAALTMSLTAAIMACAGTVGGQDQALQEKINKLEQRVAELEEKGPAAAVEGGKPWDAWLGSTKFSGFVSSSFLYNFNRSKEVTGRTFDIRHNEFQLNKLKLTFEKPVDYNAEKWDAGYRADLIFGEDAQVIAPINGPTLGDAGDYEQVYGTVNIPVGQGVQVSFGRMVTLMGLEVIEETANPNWSLGNQFIFAENFTSTGVQVSYKWSEKLDTQVRVNNGWDTVRDNNNSLSYMGRIGYTFNDYTSVAVVGYGGPEQTDNNGAWRKGVNLLISQKITPKLTAYLQGDYGHEDANAALPNPGDAQWWAGGAWLRYDFNEYVGVAVRGDYFHDRDGARTSDAPFLAPFPVNTGQDLTSLTATLNITPIKNLQVRPEVRWDHSDLGGGAFRDRTGPGARKNQVTALLGVAYLF
jgi:hypothetical protein